MAHAILEYFPRDSTAVWQTLEALMYADTKMFREDQTAINLYCPMNLVSRNV